jgi:bacteriorhodopsin
VFCENILEMRKEIGKWFLDIAKYVATAVLIASFLGDFEQKWLMYAVGMAAVISSFFIGLYFIKDKKK